ncbi:hypothetical protein GN956_G4286 [Arapaima gigas]
MVPPYRRHHNQTQQVDTASAPPGVIYGLTWVRQEQQGDVGQQSATRHPKDIKNKTHCFLTQRSWKQQTRNTQNNSSSV